MYDIDRKTASRLLKLSIRTVDRYIVAKKLSSEERDGRIWLNKKEILRIKAQKRVDSGQSVSTPQMSTDKPGVNTQENVNMVSTPNEEKDPSVKQNSGSGIYKKLYEEAQQELHVKQERLEGANYRVGQLEAMVKDAIPRLDHQRLLGEEKTLLNKERALLNEERLNRRVYMVILIIVMILQPVWLWLAVVK